MLTPIKATIDEIRARFDNDVERFSNLETGQTAMMDSRALLDAVADAAEATAPHARSLLDIGCGAGNFTLILLERLPQIEHITLNDLSRPMLDRAQQRIPRPTTAIQGNILDIDLEPEHYDLIVAAGVLHHMRTDDEWRRVFANICRSLRPGGAFWISDMVRHENPQLQARLWQRYGEYLEALKNADYRDHVFSYIAHEDTPHTINFQLDLLRENGLHHIDIVHKRNCFAVFGGVK
jgi:tRNA (cmo5U34)-methyltransferase